MKKLTHFLIIFSFVLTGAITAFGEASYPERPITLIIPYGAGGMTDTTSRILAEGMKQKLEQQMLVLNKKGAGGFVGVSHFLSTKPDGYTVLVADTAALVDPAFRGKEPFDAKKFSFIGGYMAQARIIVVKDDSPFKTWEELIAYAKKNPGKVSFGAGGSSWSNEAIKSYAVEKGFKARFITLDSGAEASASMLGGHVTACEIGVGAPAYLAAKAGKARILLSLSPGKVPGFPEVPNVLDKNYKFNIALVYGFFLHAETPIEVKQKLEEALKFALSSEVTQTRFKKLGVIPHFYSSEEFGGYCADAVKSVVELKEFIKKAEAEGKL